MRVLSVDPSSTNLGWAVLDDDSLIAHGVISTKKVVYERRYLHITDELMKLRKEYSFDEVACERAIRFEGKRIPALEVAVKAIEKWAERRKWVDHPLPIYFYSPSEWKRSVAGAGNADKAAVARCVCLIYPQLPEDVSDHETDAIAIGQHHLGVRRLELMSIRQVMQ